MVFMVKGSLGVRGQVLGRSARVLFWTYCFQDTFETLQRPLESWKTMPDAINESIIPHDKLQRARAASDVCKFPSLKNAEPCVWCETIFDLHLSQDLSVRGPGPVQVLDWVP